MTFWYSGSAAICLNASRLGYWTTSTASQACPLGDQGGLAVTGAEELAAVLLGEGGGAAGVRLIGGAAAGCEAQQVEHGEGAAGVVGQQSGERGSFGVDRHG